MWVVHTKYPSEIHNPSNLFVRVFLVIIPAGVFRTPWTSISRTIAVRARASICVDECGFAEGVEREGGLVWTNPTSSFNWRNTRALACGRKPNRTSERTKRMDDIGWRTRWLAIEGNRGAERTDTYEVMRSVIECTVPALSKRICEGGGRKLGENMGRGFSVRVADWAEFLAECSEVGWWNRSG